MNAKELTEIADTKTELSNITIATYAVGISIAAQLLEQETKVLGNVWTEKIHAIAAERMTRLSKGEVEALIAFVVDKDRQAEARRSEYQLQKGNNKKKKWKPEETPSEEEC